MAPRPHWKGYLKLSLVSCPIALYPAISPAERISFRQVNRQTGNRLKQQFVDSVTGDVVQSYDKGRGYEVGQNQFLMIEEEELEAAQQEARSRPYSAARASSDMRSLDVREDEPSPQSRKATTQREDVKPEALVPTEPPPPPVRIENNRTIDIERFVPRAQIDPLYFDKPYYIAPRDEVGQEAFAVIRDAMRGKDMVGMGRVVLSNRERPIIVEPMGDGLRGVTLRYAHEVRSAEEYFADIPKITLPEEMLRVAEHILETKTADFDTAYLEDRYRTVLVDMLKEKSAGLPKKPMAPAPSPENVVNLMDALKRSLAVERPLAASGPAKPRPRRTSTGQNAPQAKRTHARARKTG
jgi:non-homologous end joining protein Ku